MGLRLMRYVHNLPIINELYWGEFKKEKKRLYPMHKAPAFAGFEIGHSRQSYPNLLDRMILGALTQKVKKVELQLIMLVESVTFGCRCKP